MILQVQLDNNEEFTNIGFAKAISDALCIKVTDLEEIGEHLLLVAKYRRIHEEMAKMERMGVENEPL